ncbi:hypothetical protein JL720_2021 [Aureococcus anophagefferens]|nr:hypothetical protein JL720_2021 [Aureococcus anophagefferens]
MTGETEFNGNVFSSKCLPITLAARGVKVDLWDAFIGDLLGLPSLGLGRVECCVVATVGCPVFIISQCERSSSSLCAGRARLWRERANAVCLRHAPAFGVLGISLKATVATDDISRLDGSSELELGEPWQGTCVEFSWAPPATALVLREGGDGSLKSGLENLAGKALRGIFGGPAPRPKPDSKTAYWEALPLGPADTPCVHVPVPRAWRPARGSRSWRRRGRRRAGAESAAGDDPRPGPARALDRGDGPDPSSPKATSIPVPTLNQLAAGNQLAAPTSPQMQRDAAVAGQVVGVAAMAPGAPPMNPVVAGAAAGPVAQVVGGGCGGQVVGAAQPYTEQYVAAVRRNSMRQEIPVATVQRVSMTGADADWKGFGKDGAKAKSSGAADALHAAEAVALIGAAAAAAGIAISKSMK